MPKSISSIPRARRLGLPVVEPRERVLRQIGEDGGELHA